MAKPIQYCKVKKENKIYKKNKIIRKNGMNSILAAGFAHLGPSRIGGGVC